ncbi:MAG: hypothetical protein IJ197_07025 [Bacteroidaceae bacterium]|nr:hypothetical protein [Bacteroidaceae bacterium]
MDTTVQWATILSPIIAVGIAAWTSYNSSKDTRKQVRAIRDLCILQNSTTLDILEMELYKYSLGKVNDNVELHALLDEMAQLKQEWNPDPKELKRIQHKIEQLSKNASIKQTFEYKIIMRQFALMRGIENLKRMK